MLFSGSLVSSVVFLGKPQQAQLQQLLLQHQQQVAQRSNGSAAQGQPPQPKATPDLSGMVQSIAQQLGTGGLAQVKLHSETSVVHSETSVV